MTGKMSGLFCALALAMAVGLCGTARAAPIYFVATSQQGANVTVDVNHTQHWTYGVSADVSHIVGGMFSMKRGPQTIENVTFSIFQGTFAEYGLATPLLEVTLTPSSFSQSYALVPFQVPEAQAITLHANTAYTAVLASAAGDAGSRQYFLKDGLLKFVDGAGNDVDPGGNIIPGGPTGPGGEVSAVPLPAAAPAGLLLLGCAAVYRRLRRRPG
jgi:hypothetical protein